MKKLCLILMGMLLGLAAYGADGNVKIREQFIDYSTARTVSESAVARNIERIRSDGTWADIDYASQRRGDWPTLNHLTRAESLAVAYAKKDSEWFQSDDLKEAVLSALQHWIDHDYRNPNWWQGRIGVPKSLCSTMILLGDELPQDMKADLKPILNRSKMGMTGQNKVWCAGIAFMKGLLYDDSELMNKAIAEIWSELRVSTGEGIQPDWSFHQHGPQQQFGNYGMSFASDMIKWGTILRGTDYALSGDKLEIIRNYMLDGVSWIIWNGRMDFSGCGRQIDQGAQQQKGRYTFRALDAMQEIDPTYKSHYENILNRNGFKPFWRSEMGVQRRPDWYASVKMSSTRVIGSETCNSENMQGLHLGDGTLLIYQDGSEYEDIVPVWDWKRLPGTTCDQGLDQLKPKGASGGYGYGDFSGVLGSGETGMAAMVYKRDKLTARKAYFFFEDHIVCLGAGILGETAGAVYTSVQQSWLKGEVQQGDSWVQHDGVRYQFLDGTPELKTGLVKGNWEPSFTAKGDRPAEGDVFSVWIDHGQSPNSGTYAYRIFPDVENGSSAFAGLSEVLSNTASIQAVAGLEAVFAVFYEADHLTIGEKVSVETDGPCLMQLSEGHLTVADPTHSLQILNVKIDHKTYTVNLPQGADSGKQIEVY